MDSTICVICTEGISKREDLECGHVFCKDCIKEWFKSKRICPICRSSSDKFPNIEAQGIGYDYEEYEDDYDLTDSDESYINDSSSDEQLFWDDGANTNYNYNTIYSSIGPVRQLHTSWNIPFRTEQIIGRAVRHSTHGVGNLNIVTQNYSTIEEMWDKSGINIMDPDEFVHDESNRNIQIDVGKQFEEMAIRLYKETLGLDDNLLEDNISSDEEFEKIIDKLDILMIEDDE